MNKQETRPSRATTYRGAHRHVEARRGRATEHQCPCGKQARHWAYTHDDPCPEERIDPKLGLTFSNDPERYRALCVSCHGRYDNSHKTHCPRNHPYEGYNLIIERGKRTCRACKNAATNVRRQKWTPEFRARQTRLAKLARDRRLAAKS